ncbi:MAG: NAD(P)-dependent oxidoreductase [Pseudomonadota bacterium]
MSQKIIVTGGTGFIGHHAVAALKASGHEVIVPTSRTPSDPQDGVTYVNCDLTSSQDIETLVKQSEAKALLHIAWRNAVSGLWSAPENSQWLQSSLELVRVFLAEGGERVTVCGSCGEYDWSGGLCQEDETQLRPSTIYGTAKVSMLHGVKAMCETAGASFAWGRPFFIYGPREHESRLGASVILSLLKGMDAECSHGMQLRDYCHVGDVGRGLAALAESKLTGEYNLGSGQAIRVRDLIEAIAEEIGRPDLVRLGAREAPAFEPPLIVADMTKTRQSGLDWEPQFTLESGVRETVEWFRQA